MTEVLRTELVEKDRHNSNGTRTYRVKLLHEFGQFAEGFRDKKEVANKVADLWAESSQHDVLFTDYTRGDPEAFMDVFFDPRGVWTEIDRVEDGRIIGAVYLTRVLPHIDCYGHFTLWDGKAKGREPLMWDILEWVFDRYDLHRLSAEIPAFQSGLLKFLKRLGFKVEGERRESRLHKGSWVNDLLLGVLREDYEEARDGWDAIR